MSLLLKEEKAISELCFSFLGFKEMKELLHLFDSKENSKRGKYMV
jgi:hypothetical protein